MAQSLIDAGGSGGRGLTDAERKAIQRKLTSQTSKPGASLVESFQGDTPPPSSQPTVASKVSGPSASQQQSILSQLAAANAASEARNPGSVSGTRAVPSGGLAGPSQVPAARDDSFEARRQRGAEQSEAARRLEVERGQLNTNEAGTTVPFAIPGGALTGAVSGIGKVLSPIAQAVTKRLGASGLPNAAKIGQQAASQVGKTGTTTQLGTRLTSGVAGPAGPASFVTKLGRQGADDVLSGAQQANQLRSAAAGLREAATAPRTFAPTTPIGQAVLGRLGRAVNPLTVGAGVATGVGASQVGGSQAAQQQPQQNAPQTESGVLPPRQLTPTTPALPGTQGTQGTPATSPFTTIPTRLPGADLGPGIAGPSEPKRDPFSVTPEQQAEIDRKIRETAEGNKEPGGEPPEIIPGEGGPTFGGLPQFGGGGGRPPGLDQIQQSIMGDLNGLVEMINAGPQTPNVMALYASQAEKILALIGQQEQEIRSEAATAGQTVDPATQNLIDQLKEALGRGLKETKERLNARGLLNSGILIEAEQMLTKGNLSDQGRILAERLSGITENLNAQLAALRSQRTSTAQSFGMAGLDAQTAAEQAERQRLQEMRGQVIQGRTQLAGQMQQSYEGEQNRSLDVYLQQIQQQFSADEAIAQREFDWAREQASLAAQRQDVAAERQWKARESEIERAWESRQNELTRAQQGALAELNQQGQTYRQQPSVNTSRLATDDVIAQLQQFPDRESALSEAQAAQGQAGYEAVNWLEVQNAINELFPEQSGFKFPWQ